MQSTLKPVYHDNSQLYVAIIMDSEDEREIAKEIQYFAAHGTYYWRRFGMSLVVVLRTSS